MVKTLFLIAALFICPCIAIAGTVSYYIYDMPNRSVSVLTDNNGNALNQYSYDAFGNKALSQENVSNNFGYVAEQFDKEPGLLFLRNRYYDPAIGRFITKDPVSGSKMIPQTKNPYPYCNNNPVSYVDPNGDIVLNVLGGILGATVSGFMESMNPNSTLQSVAAAALIGGGVSLFAPNFSVNPVLLAGATAATRNAITTLIRKDEITSSSLSKSFTLGMLGGAMGQGIGKLAESDVLGKLMSANMGLWLGSAFSDYKFDNNTQSYYNDRFPNDNVTLPSQQKINDRSRDYFGGPNWPDGGGGGSSLGGGNSGGNDISFSASFAPASFGGVSLSKTASLLTDLSEIKGAFYDDKTGQIILMGKQNLSLPQMKLEDLAVAVNSVYSGKDPGVSIDPPLVNNQFSVRYDGKTSNSEFGYIMFEADRVMKTLGLGKDNISGSSVTSSVTGYKNLLDRYRESNSLPEGESSHRFWFKPKEVKLVKSPDGNSMVFDTVTMECLTESKFQGDVTLDPVSEAFAQNLTQYYQDYANERPIFKDLERLGKVTSIVKWIKDNDIPIDLSFIGNYQVAAYATPGNTPATQVSTQWQDGNIIRTLTMTGGVTYTKPNEYLADSSVNPIADPLKDSAISQRPAETNFKWNFTSSQNENLTAVAESFSRSRKDGNLSFAAVDLSYPADSDFALEFVRFYDSFYEKASGFGYGWEYRPFQIRFPENKQNFTFTANNLILSLNAQVYLIDRQSGREDLYELLGIDSNNLPLYAKSGQADLLRENSDSTWALNKVDKSRIIFDNQGNLLSLIDKNNKAISYVYQNAKLTSIDAGLSGAINISYGADNIISIAGPGPRTIIYNYDASGNLISVTNAQKQTTSFAYDTDHRITKITDARNNVVFEGAYDDYNRLTTSKINSELDFSSNFNLSQRKTQETDPNLNNYLKFYDDKYRVIKQEDHLGNRVDVNYAGDSGPQAITDAKGASTTYTYDARGNVSSVTQPDSSQLKLYYDSKDNLIAVKDALGNDTAYDYDASNRLIYIYHRAILNFDISGNLTGWQYDPVNITTFSYDAGTGHLLSVTNPEGRQQVFDSYNANGLPQAIKSTSGFTLTNVYDSLSRLKSINDPAGNSISFSYTNADQIKSITTSAGASWFDYDANNNLISAKDANANTTAFGYDAKNNLQDVTDPELGMTSYGYDKFNKLTGVTLPNNTKFSYEFDDLNRLVLVKSGMGMPTPVIAVLEDSFNVGTAVLGNSISKALTVYNIGTKELTITDASSNSGLFVVDYSATVIPRGESFTYNITFTPQVEGPASGILTINSDDLEVPVVNINLSAQATLPSIKPTANSVINGVQINWKQYSNPDNRFNQYKIYRSASPITSISGLSPIVAINSISTITYTDITAVAGTKYYYTAAAFDVNGNKLTAIEPYGPVAYLNLGRIGGIVNINSAYHEKNSSIAYNTTAKEYLVVYEYDTSGSVSNYDIYGQRISGNGDKIGSPFPVADTNSQENNPHIAYNSVNNEFLVVCDSGSHAIGQRISADGAKIGSWFYIVQTTTRETKPRLIYNPAQNQYLMVMEYDHNGDGARWDIIRCLLGASGNTFSTFVTSTTDPNIQFHNPSVSYNSVNNEYLVAFEYTIINTNDCEIAGLKIDSGNTAIGNAFYVSLPSLSDTAFYYPRLAYNPDTNVYVCAYERTTISTQRRGLGLSRVTSTGSINLLKAYFIPNKNALRPEIAYFNANKEYFSSFTTNVLSTTELNIEGQRMSANLDFITPSNQLIVIGDSANIEKNNSVVYNPDKIEFLSAYEFDANNDASNYDIKGQRIGVLALMLSMDPVGLDFGDTEIANNLRVNNSGGAPMLLSARVDKEWLQVNPLTISTSSATADFTITVSRSALAPASYSGNVFIDYGGGTLIVPVTMIVEAHPPDAPYDPVPTDGAVNQKDLASTLSVTVNWVSSDPDPGDTLSYDLYFSNESAKVSNLDASCKVSSSQSQNSYMASGLQYLTTYYWRVVAKDSYGLSTAGPVWRFTTAGIAAPQIIPFSPDPTNNKRPTFSWNSVNGAVKYHVQVGTDAGFSVPLVDNANLFGIAYTLTADLPEGKIYWRVSSVDGLGNESVFSAADDFTVKTLAPAVPALIAYLPNPTREQRPQLNWQAVSETISYRIQISNTVDFSNLIVDKYVTAANYIPENNLPEGPIYWRVAGRDSAGNESVFSGVSEFRIDITAPAQITGLSASAAQTQITLNWSPLNNIDGDFSHFNIYRSDTPIINVSDLIVLSEIITDPFVTTFTDTAVTEDAAYYYAVTAEDILGNENKAVAGIGPVVIPTNQVPVLDPIEGRIVSEGQLLEFNISASDSDSQNLIYSISGLPAGAYFSPERKLFSWLPGYSQQGSYVIHFEVSDGAFIDSEDITVIVNNTPVSPASGQSAGISLKIRVLN